MDGLSLERAGLTIGREGSFSFGLRGLGFRVWGLGLGVLGFVFDRHMSRPCDGHFHGQTTSKGTKIFQDKSFAWNPC